VPLVLAIEPDLRQAAIVKRVVRERVDADVTVVDSRDAAVEAIRARMPDVLLLSALLSPRDEDELISHLQTHTIPQLASALRAGEDEGGKGLFGRFRKKKDKEVVISGGCDPEVFAEEIRTYLKWAEEKKTDRELYAHKRIVVDTETTSAKSASAYAESQSAPAGSSWADPFAWPAGGARASSSAAPQRTEPETVVSSAPRVVEQPVPAEPPFAGDALADGPMPEFEPVHVAGFEPLFDAPPAAPPQPITIPAAVLALRDFVDPLCMWARAERPAKSAADEARSPADLRSMLAALAVPEAVASVRYPRGCRIRRLRVLPSMDAQLAEVATL
jgi:hypothetical protein